MTTAPFTHAAWKALLDQTFAEIHKLADLKGAEYSGDTDRLLNFRRNATALGLRMETVWAVYAAKHWDALMQYIQDEQAGRDKRQRLESIDGRVDDLLTYLLLFKAMLQEGRDASWVKAKAADTFGADSVRPNPLIPETPVCVVRMGHKQHGSKDVLVSQIELFESSGWFRL